ncbi:MFS transporter [Agromyces marinus]|uniref:MFS transporter n=1 Tax=Agromyces marinus TaxID=1389020 RepID=A0ABM8H1M7_9MICO|nr:MFS transporter [Agromyces marinus]UIP57256.1 Inner membrane protein YbjJ [Agromyces marinus]BDZ54653.1 MFS transporter [Agromyces marinus]
MSNDRDPAPGRDAPRAPAGDDAAEASARPRRELVAWRNAVFAVFFLSGFGLASWVARIPAIRDAVGLSTQGVGFVILGGSIASVVGLVAAPWLMARFGARAGMIGTLATASIGLVAVGLGGSLLPSIALIVVGLACFGFGNGAVDVMMNVEGAEAERELGRTVMPLMHAFFSFGTVAGAALAAAASALGVPISVHLSLIAALIAAGVVVAVRFVPLRPELGDLAPDAPRDPIGVRLRRSLAVWADVRLLLIGVVMLGMSFAEGSANDWIALAVVDGHGLDETTGAAVFTVFTIAITTARVLGGPFIDRFGRVAMLRVMAGIGIAGLALFIFGTEPWMLVVGTLMWGVGCSLAFPVGMSAAADVPDRADAAARVSAVAMIGYCAFLVGPPLLGFLGERFGILNALLVLLGLMVVAGIAAPAARERARARPPAE